MTNSPVSINISPVGFRAMSGQSVVITVTDYGNKPMTVTGVSTLVRPDGIDKCTLSLANNSLVFRPERFTLAGGKSLRVSVTVNHAVTGEHLAALFEGNAGTTGNGRISAGVGAQIAIKTGQINCSGSNAQPIAASAGIPVAIPIIGTAFVVLAAWGYYLRRNRYRRQH